MLPIDLVYQERLFKKKTITMRPDFICVIDGKPQWNVSRCEQEPGGRYRVVFTKDGQPSKSFSYSAERIRKYDYSRTESGDVFFRKNDGRYLKENGLHVYGNAAGEDRYYLKEKENGYIEFYSADERSLHHSVKESESGLFCYLKAIAELNQIPTEEGDGSISLSQKYDKIDNIFDDSVMAMYLAPKKNRPILGREVPFLVFPFGCNSGQWDAVRNAVSGDVSVIQGPPGTGKTQTILNIVANQILLGKTTQVVSNNNSAVDNVKEKLDAHGYGFLAVTLGRKAFKDAFFGSQSGVYPDLSSWKRDPKEMEKMKVEISSITAGLPKYFSGLERLSVLREEIDELKEQERLYKETMKDVPALSADKERLFGLFLNPLRLPSGKLYRFLFRYEEEMQRRGKPSFSLRCKSLFYGFGYSIPGRDSVEQVARKKKIFELEKEKEDTGWFCRSFKHRYERYVGLSKEYFNASLYETYQKDNPPLSRTVYSEDETWKDPTSFLKDYPVVLSSAYSATSNISKYYTFDMLIMDEASQCDVAVGALALNCTRSAVIVGDEKQLPNVIPDTLKEKAAAIGRAYHAPQEYAFEGRSFLSSFRSVFPDAPVSFLKEHYRCEPRIIGYCNQQFYDGRLVPMTIRSEENPLSVIVAAKDTHPRPQRNEPQAMECVKRVLELRERFPDIGVIVPYNAQAELISGLLSDEGISNEDIPVSTVHKFQGRERDAILLCTVDNTVKEFVDDPHLLNVAVSRARKNFTLVISDGEIPDGNIKALKEYVEYCGGQTIRGNIRSVFDILYKPYREEREAYIKEHPKVSEYITENLVAELLDSITSEERWAHLGVSFQYPLKAVVANWDILSDDEKRYTGNDFTLIDFVLFDKTTRRPVLAIEVDGMAYHKEGTRQWERDRMKDSVLEKMGLPLLRLSTEGKQERERIENALSGQ